MTEPFDAFLARLRAESDPVPPVRYGRYRSYRALWERVHELVGAAPPEAFGVSTGGEPLWAITLRGAAVVDGVAPRRRVLYLANLHAQELIGVECVLAVMAAMGERIRAGDTRYADLEATFVPTANPDGYRRVIFELAHGAPRFRRKNLRGVDLNRNFPEGWNEASLAARLLRPLYNRGRAPLSEPETAALDTLFARRFDRALSFHSFGGYLFWPWACRDEPTVDEWRFEALAAAMQARMERPYLAAQLGRYARWLRPGGAEIDQLYGRYGTLAFLVEVSEGGRRLDPRTWLDAFAFWNPADVAREVRPAVDAALALVETELPPRPHSR